MLYLSRTVDHSDLPAVGPVVPDRSSLPVDSGLSSALLFFVSPSSSLLLHVLPAVSVPALLLTVMSSAASHWGTLINPDKSPAPLLEQLCLGIAQLMVSGLIWTQEQANM